MSQVELLKQRVIAAVEANRDRLIEIADTIFANPEVAFEEYQAAALLTGALEQSGFEVERGVAGMETAFVGTLHGREPGPTIAFLAEYDALPEIGHACAHNIIGTSALGAGLAMQAALPELAGTVKVIGTPAEEGGGGKIIMVNHGVFDGVDAAMMVHPANYNITRRRSRTYHSVKIEFHGKASHAGGSPDMGINALDAVIQTFNGINALRQHLRDDARIHGIITHGGVISNVVPDYAAASFGVRSLDLRYSQELLGKVRACAQAGALATGAELEFTVSSDYYDAMLPNPVLADLTDANMAALNIEVRLPDPAERMGSTDMGNVSQTVPALHPYISIAPPEVAGHTVEFREISGSPAGHRGLLQAAKLMAMTAIDLLANSDHMAAVKKAFTDQRKG